MKPRRRVIAISVGAIALGAIFIASNPAGVTALGSPSGGHRAADPVAASLGFVGVGTNNFDALHDLTSGSITADEQVATGGSATSGSAISPDGDTAVFADFAADLSQIEAVRSANPTPGPTLDLAAYAGEGGGNYKAFSSSVALSDGFGLAGLDSQGLLQLRFRDGAWQVDDRVQAPGRNEDGLPHQPGWIRFGKSGKASVFESVAISNVPLPNGKYLALSTDRGKAKGVLAVVEGVGTATPELVGKLRSPGFKELAGESDTGTGGIAFSPATATRALVATNHGIDVIDLAHPSHPKIRTDATVGTAQANTAIAVSPDGNHVALASANTVHILKGVLHPSGTLASVGKLVLAPADSETSAMEYLSDGRLVITYSGLDSTATVVTPYASVVTHAQRKDPEVGSTGELTDLPDDPNSMSVYPAVAQPTIRVTPTHVRVGKAAKIKLKVHDGYGTYSFTVKGGKLPAGLSIDGDKIVGTPTHTGEKTFTLRAKDQYDGAAYLRVTIAVH